MAMPSTPATRMTIGSGAFLSLSSAASVISAIAAVGKSMMARLPSTNAAPPIAPAAAAVTPVVGCREDHEQVARQKDTDRRHHRTQRSRNEIANERDGDDNGPRCDH